MLYFKADRIAQTFPESSECMDDNSGEGATESARYKRYNYKQTHNY